MKKIEEVSKKIEEATQKVEAQVKEKVAPKVRGLETIILGVLLAMVAAGLVGGKGLMIVAGVLSALILGLPKYSDKLSKLMPEDKKADEAKVESAEVKEAQAEKGEEKKEE